MQQTLHDILSECSAAEAAGHPVVPNWVQTRAGFSLLARAEDLHSVTIDEFPDRFPESFESLDAHRQEKIMSAYAYETARRQVAQVIALQTGSGDGWRIISSYLCRINRSDTARFISPLRRHALADGLASRDLTTEWAANVDERLGTGLGRQMLRAGIREFNWLFDLPEIARSGILPAERIGKMPEYDGLNRRFIELPPRLAAIGSNYSRLKLVWNTGCHAGILDRTSDPDAGDLLDPDIWARLEKMDPKLHGVQPTVWRIYMNASGLLLEKHSDKKRPKPKLIPDHLETVPAETPEDRAAIRALWREICALNDERVLTMGPDELLQVEVWRSIWRSTGEERVAKSLKGYEVKSRKALLRAASEMGAPPLRDGLVRRL